MDYRGYLISLAGLNTKRWGKRKRFKCVSLLPPEPICRGWKSQPEALEGQEKSCMTQVTCSLLFEMAKVYLCGQ